MMLILIMSMQLGDVVYSGTLKSRVPSNQLEKAQSLMNPFPVTKTFVEKGRILYEGRAFCWACHGRDGQGLPVGPGSDSSTQPLPTNFSNDAWQAARSDGEIYWILKHGSHGTDMAGFMPQYVNEKEGWQLVSFLRSLKGT